MMHPRKVKLTIGYVVLVGGGVLALLVPTLRASAALRRECEVLQGRVVASDNGAAALQRLADRLAISKQFSDEITVPIPESSGVAGLIRELSEKLDALGIEGREITTGVPTELELASSMPMAVTMEGSFLNVYEAVEWIEHLPRLIRVQRLTIKHVGRDRSDPSGLVRGEMLLDVFFAPVGDPVDAVADAGGTDQ